MDIEYLIDMYNDTYYPPFLVDKIKEQIVKVVEYLQASNHSLDEIQHKLDIMTMAINDLEAEFDAHNRN